MFCPECESEYIDGITECAECHVPLVETLYEDNLDNPRAITSKEDLIPVMTFLDREEAIIAKGFLTTNGVDAILSSDETIRARRGISSPKGIQLLIRPEDKQNAQAIFDLVELHLDETLNSKTEDKYPNEVRAQNSRKETATKVIFLILLAAIILLIVKSLL